MVVGLHGSYYVRNFGDTLLVNIVYNWIKDACPGSDIILPFVTSHAEAVEIMNGNDNESYKQHEIKDCSKFVFAGGGYFGEPNVNWLKMQRWSYRNYKRHVAWNGILYDNKIPYAILGVGVGPLTNKLLRKKVIKLIENAAFVCVRDNESFNYLKSWGVKNPNLFQTTDLALTVRRDKSEPETARKTLGIHFPLTSTFPREKIADIVKFITRAAERYDIKLINDIKGQMAPGKSTNITDQLTVPFEQIEYNDPEDLINQLNKLDAIVTTKLHVGILGYALKKPVVSLPSHQKTIRFYKQIGRDKFCISVKDVNLENLTQAFDQCVNTPVTHDSDLMEKALFSRNKLIEFLSK